MLERGKQCIVAAVRWLTGVVCGGKGGQGGTAPIHACLTDTAAPGFAEAQVSQTRWVCNFFFFSRGGNTGVHVFIVYQVTYLGTLDYTCFIYGVYDNI